MSLQTMIVECYATTPHGRSVVLPAGSEVTTSRDDLSDYMAANPDAKTIRLDCRSRRAKKAAPYDVNLDDLWLAVE